MNTIYAILAQAADAAQGATQEQAAQGGGSNMLIIMLLFLGAMYFFMIAPQRKRQKQHEQMLNGLKAGDEIVTIGGIYGKITNKTDKTFTVKIADSVKIEVRKDAVYARVDAATNDVVKDGAMPEESKPEEIQK
ncbi:MAG: preprotein translocase subunit YajC [Opitutales bacterium]|nr:preprotein translocase subunit YajC [Opitutales bacterium]